MKHFFTKIAFAISAIILCSGIVLIRAMTTTDPQTIMEDIATAQDQMMETEAAKSAIDTTMTSEMQEIAEPAIAMQPIDDETIGEEFTEPIAESEDDEIIAIDEQPVDEEGTPVMEDMSDQQEAEQEAQEVDVFMEGEDNTDPDLAP